MGKLPFDCVAAAASGGPRFAAAFANTVVRTSSVQLYSIPVVKSSQVNCTGTSTGMRIRTDAGLGSQGAASSESAAAGWHRGRDLVLASCPCVCGSDRFDLKESSSFRNEHDAVSAGIRTGPNPQIFSSFFPDKAPFIETPRIWGF